MKNVLAVLPIALFISLFTVVSSGYTDDMLQVLPTSFSDRTFPYLQVSEAFAGIPLQTEALVPHALIVVGEKETSDILVQAAGMAYMIGQWSQDPGTSVTKVRQGKSLFPVVLDRDLTDEDIHSFNLIAVGKKNSIYERLADKLKGQGSFIEVVENGLTEGRDVMIVSDPKAAAYLANKRLYFASGAYRGFFNFVATRLFIGDSNFAAATFSLDNPEGVRACGKPVVLMTAGKENLPPEMLKVAQKRNTLVFKDLREALAAKDKQGSIKAWEAAMETCYSCHQGKDGVPKYRKFTPNEGVHSYHQRIVKKFGVGCTTCHKGKTTIVGY